MQKLSIRQIESDIVFPNIYGIDQVWKEGESWSFIGNPRPEHALMYLFCEKAHVVYKDKSECTFHKGDLLYLPKYCEYTVTFWGVPDAHTDTQVNFDIRNTAGEEFCLADTIVCFTSDASQKMITNMREIAEFSTNVKHPCLHVTKLFYSLLEALANRASMPDVLAGEQSTVFPAVVYLDNHIRDNVPIAALAKMCLLSESAFRKAFRAYTGMSPSQYRTHARISKAQVLLQSAAELSIDEIAAGLGYYDTAYFHKTFLKATGMTPKQYRILHT